MYTPGGGWLGPSHAERTQPQTGPASIRSAQIRRPERRAGEGGRSLSHCITGPWSVEVKGLASPFRTVESAGRFDSALGSRLVARRP
jgi:hypothetical protein